MWWSLWFGLWFGCSEIHAEFTMGTVLGAHIKKKKRLRIFLLLPCNKNMCLQRRQKRIITCVSFCPGLTPGYRYGWTIIHIICQHRLCRPQTSGSPHLPTNALQSGKDQCLSLVSKRRGYCVQIYSSSELGYCHLADLAPAPVAFSNNMRTHPDLYLFCFEVWIMYKSCHYFLWYLENTQRSLFSIYTCEIPAVEAAMPVQPNYKMWYKPMQN